MAELVIVFREVLEASLIVGILYTYLMKTGQTAAIIKLWQGVLSALALSLLGSFLFQKLVGGFQGQAEKLFEGFVMIIAAIVLGTMIVWMAKNRNIADDLKEKADYALNSEKLGYGILVLCFIVFLAGIIRFGFGIENLVELEEED